jgi:oxygen-independent coproporphyrinogen III oxidase
MAGVYIHIPFCRTKCDYCNFFSIASLRGKNEIAGAICKEIKLRSEYLGGQEISTIYFGGGTPSLLPAKDIETVLNSLRKSFGVSSNAEITLEANPDDLDKEKLKAYRQMGVNRLSIGIQSFLPDDLKYLSRKHDPQQALKAIEDSVEAGFLNTTIDLIFGLPTQDIPKLEKNLKTFRQFNLPHLSAYALTVESKTALAWKIENKKVEAVSDENQIAQFLFLMDWMTEEDFVQYEISNYCLPGYESKHNSAYWKGESYIGLGPSAHSFNSASRQWNVSNLAWYLEAIKAGNVFFEKESLTPNQHHNEYVMTAIRTKTGIDLDAYTQRFGKNSLAELHSASAEFLKDGWVIEHKNHLILSRQGKLFADYIASEMFVGIL